MKLPKIALRGSLSSNKTREVQLPNILKIDPTLVDLLENKLGGVSTQDGFKKWKKQFLDRLKQDLNNDHGGVVASKNNQQQQRHHQDGDGEDDEEGEVGYSAWSYVSMSHENFRKRIDLFCVAVSKVNRHVSSGTLTHNTVSTKAQNSLSEVVKQCQGIEGELKVIAPRYLSEEKTSGYNVYHLSHVFVQSNFTEYERLNKSLNTLRGLRQQVINDVAEKHILAQMDEFERFLAKFHSTTIVDTGLEDVLWKARMFNPVSATTNSHQPAIPNLRREPKPGDRGVGGRSVGTRASVNSKSTNRTSKSTVSGRSGHSGDVDVSTVGGGGDGQQQDHVKLGKISKKSPRRILSHNGRVESSAGVRKKLPTRSKSTPSGSSDESIDLQSNDGSADNSNDIPKSTRKNKAPTSPRKGENKQPHRKSREERSGGRKILPTHQKDSGSEDSSRDGGGGGGGGGEADNSNVKRKDKNGRNNQSMKKQSSIKRQNSLRRHNSLVGGGKEKENDLNIASGRSILDNAIKMSSLASKDGKSTSDLKDLSEARKLLDSMNMSDDDNDYRAGGRVGGGDGPSFTRSSNVSFAASLDSGEAANPGIIARPAGAAPLGFSKKDGVTEVKGLVRFQPNKPKKLKKKGWASMLGDDDDDDDDNKSVVSIASKNKAKRKSVLAAKRKHTTLKKPSNALRNKTEVMKKNDKKIKGGGVATKKNTTVPSKNGADAVGFAPSLQKVTEEVEIHINKNATTESAVGDGAPKGKGVAGKQHLMKPSSGGGETTGLKKKSRSAIVKSGRPEPPLLKRKNKSVEFKHRPKPQKQGSKLNIQWPPQKEAATSDTDGEGSVSSSERSSSSRGSEVTKDTNLRQKKANPAARKPQKKVSPKVKQKKSYWPSLLGAPEQEEEDNDDLSLTFDMNLLPHIPKIPDVPIVHLPEENSDPSKSSATSQPPDPLSSESEDRITNLSLPSADTVESGNVLNDSEVEIKSKGLNSENGAHAPSNRDGKNVDHTDENDPVATCIKEQSVSASSIAKPYLPAAAEKVSPESNSEDGVRPQTPTKGESVNQFERDSKSTTSPTRLSSDKSQLLSKPVDTNSLLSPLGSPKKRLSGRKLYPWDLAGNPLTKASPSPAKGPNPVEAKPEMEEQLPPGTPLDPSASPVHKPGLAGQDNGKTPALMGKLDAEHAQKLPFLSPMAKGRLGTVDRNRVSQVGDAPFAIGSSAASKSYPWNNKPEEEVLKSPIPPPPRRKLNEYSWRKSDPETSQQDSAVDQTLLKPPIPAKTFAKKNEDLLNHTPSSKNTTTNRHEIAVDANTRTEDSKAYDKTRDELKKLADSIQVPTPIQSQKTTETETSDYEQTSSMIGSIRSPASKKKSYPWEKRSVQSQVSKPGLSTNKDEQPFFPFSSDVQRSYPWNKSEVTSKYQPSGSKSEKQQQLPPAFSSIAKKAYPWGKADAASSKSEPATQVGIGLKKSRPWNMPSKENPSEMKDTLKTASGDGMAAWQKRMNWQSKEKETDVAASVTSNQNALLPDKTIAAGKATSLEIKQNDHPVSEGTKKKDDTGDTKQSLQSLLWGKMVDSTSKDEPADRMPSNQESERPATSILPASSHHQKVEIFSDTQHSHKVLANESIPSDPSKRFKPVSSWSKPSLADDDDELSHPLKKPKDKKVRSAVGVRKTAKPRPGRMKPQHTDDSSVVKMKKSNKKKGEMTFTKKADPRLGRVDNKPRGRGNRTFVHKQSIPMAPGVKSWGRNPFEN